MKDVENSGVPSGFIGGGCCKRLYRDILKTSENLLCLSEKPNRAFANIIFRDLVKYTFRRNRPIEGETRERAKAALDWLYLAQDSTDDDGVSLGYFPCNVQAVNGWRPSYPETTGYIIHTFMDYASQYNDDEARQRAMRMVVWEMDVQMSGGAVQGGPVCSPEKQIAAVFNTGMVLQGYTAVLSVEKDDEVLKAAYRAAEYLVNDLDRDGHFRSHGVFVTPEKIKTYNCLCAWALFRFGNIVNETRYRKAALAAIFAAVDQQNANGWIANNCLTRSEAPLLHTIAYALQGILEVGVLAGNAGLIETVRRGVDPLLGQMTANGFLKGRYYANWRPANHSSCLTGNAQMAVICYRLFEMTGEKRYLMAADRFVNYLKGLQMLDSPNVAINGALAGSHPILWGYMAVGYPNWATKYFLDSLLLQERISR